MPSPIAACRQEFTALLAWKKAHWAWLTALAVLGAAPYLFILMQGEAVLASDQMGAPGWKFYFDSLRQGVIPLWNSTGLMGMPTFDAMFGDAGYPVFILLGFLVPVTRLITVMFLLHTIIAGAGAFWLLRRFFKLGSPLAFALALAYMLNTNMVSHVHAGHTAKFYIMCWLPFSLHLLLRCLTPGTRPLHLIGLSGTIALFISTSHLQFTYYVLMGFFLVFCYYLAAPLRTKRLAEAGLVAAKFWAPVLLGVGLAFFIFYPPLKYTEAFGVRGSGEKTTYEHATSWSMHPEETASLVVPEFTGLNENYWGRNPFKLNSEYPGLLVWFFGLLGLLAFRKAWFWFWGAVGLLAIVFGLGAHTPLFHLFYSLIPGIKNFRAPSMMLFWLATALLLMAAEALRRLSADAGEDAVDEQKRQSLSRSLAIYGFGAAGVLGLMGLLPDLAFGIWSMVMDESAIGNLRNQVAAKGGLSLGALRSAALLAFLVFVTRKFLIAERNYLAFGLSAALVAAVDGFWVNSHFVTGYDPARTLPKEPAVTRLKADTSDFRVFGMPRAYERWYMQYHGIETADGWTDNETRIYREFRGGDYIQNPNLMAGLEQKPDGNVSGSVFLDLLNVKYLAFRHPQFPGLQLAENTSALPRAFFVPHWESLSDSLVLERMRQGFDPRRLAFVSAEDGLPSSPPPVETIRDAAAALPDSAGKEALAQLADAESDSSNTHPASAYTMPAPPPLAPAPPPDASVQKVSEDANSSLWRVKAPSEGLFLLSELWFPHWRVSVDGKEAPLLRVNYAMRGVRLDAGSHEVRFSYHSPWIARGLSVAGMSLIPLLLFAFGLPRWEAALKRAPTGKAESEG